MNAKVESNEAVTAQEVAPLVIMGALTLAVIYAYFNTLLGTAGFWQLPQYSHGYLIPVFVAFLLWQRYQPIATEVPASARWVGLGLLAFGLTLRVIAAYPPIVTLNMISLIPCLMGVFLMVGGWGCFKWSWPALAFLVFMYPVPDRFERLLLNPLQHYATMASTFTLQAMGLPAYSQSNTILLGELNLGVAEACSGLRMSTILVALGFAVVLLTNPNWWERIVIVVSTVPIAFASNVLRIVIQSLLLYFGYPSLADFFHVYAAAFVMMPIALGLLYLEWHILDNLFIDDDDAMQPVGFGVPQKQSQPQPVRAAPMPAGPRIPLP